MATMNVAFLVVTLLAGVIVSVVANGRTALTAVGFVLIGLAGIALVALAFYQVGRSEDRDRARGRS